jgi:hypothetical protein
MFEDTGRTAGACGVDREYQRAAAHHAAVLRNAKGKVSGVRPQRAVKGDRQQRLAAAAVLHSPEQLDRRAAQQRGQAPAFCVQARRAAAGQQHAAGGLLAQRPPRAGVPARPEPCMKSFALLRRAWGVLLLEGWNVRGAGWTVRCQAVPDRAYTRSVAVLARCASRSTHVAKYAVHLATY